MRFLKIGIATTVLVLSAGSAYLLARNTPTKIVMPEPRKAPAPNAFDFYVSASKLLNDNLETRKSTNFSPTGYNGPSIAKSGAFSPTIQYTEAEMAILIKQNSDALCELRKGFEYKCLVPQKIVTNESSFTTFASIRALGRLLVLESKVYAAHGDMVGATNSLMDSIRMSKDIQHGGNLIQALSGMASERFSRKELVGMLDRLSANDAKSLAQSMEQLANLNWPYYEVMIEEKRFGLTYLQNELKKPDWKTRLLEESADSEDTESTKVEKKNLFKYLSLTKQGAVTRYTKYMDRQIARCKLPYPVFAKQPPIPTDILSEDLAPTYEGIQIRFTNNETQTALLTTMLALHAYKLERGRCPGKLSELVPAYLASIPSDPFSRNGPLLYKLDGNNYVLYSIGPDAQDDGGKAILNPVGDSGPENRFVLPISKGDIVAGINLD